MPEVCKVELVSQKLSTYLKFVRVGKRPILYSLRKAARFREFGLHAQAVDEETGKLVCLAEEVGDIHDMREAFRKIPDVYAYMLWIYRQLMREGMREPNLDDICEHYWEWRRNFEWVQAGIEPVESDIPFSVELSVRIIRESKRTVSRETIRQCGRIEEV